MNIKPHIYVVANYPYSLRSQPAGVRLQVYFTEERLPLTHAVLPPDAGNQPRGSALIPILSRSRSLKTDSTLLAQLDFDLFAECLPIDVGALPRTMPPPFYQPRVSKCGSFDLFSVNEDRVVHSLYLCQIPFLVYFDLCVHGSPLYGEAKSGVAQITRFIAVGYGGSKR